MKGYAKYLSFALFGFLLLFLLVPGQSQAFPPQYWTPGIEQQFFGHTFAEHMWTNDSIIFESENNDTVQFIASYLNYEDAGNSFQAMLIALGVVENENGTQSTLPYQLFGLHFTTKDNKDVFAGSLLAFLFGFNDTDHNGVPSPGENRFFIIPYGFNEGNTTAPLSIEAIPVTKLSEDHYQFGIRYRNLYGRLISANDAGEFLLTLLLPLFEITFSELTVIYDIQIDRETGEITTETYYTIGQVTEFLFLGTSVPNFHEALGDIGIGVAHLGIVLTPRYYVRTAGGLPVSGTDLSLANITTDLRGRQRAFALTTRGTYDVINETTDPDTTIQSNLPAYSWILSPEPIDLILMLWQLPISATIFSIFAYAMSDYLQNLFTSPLDVLNHADTIFNTAAFWFGITFPESNGYRVEHDPVYTAFSNIGQFASPIGLVILGSVALIALIIVVLQVIRANGRRKNNHTNLK
ncbi:MAG: hypothetical protein ACFE8O_04620 [Candidatus Hermodarchaeota archaeon]